MTDTASDDDFQDALTQLKFHLQQNGPQRSNYAAKGNNAYYDGAASRVTSVAKQNFPALTVGKDQRPPDYAGASELDFGRPDAAAMTMSENAARSYLSPQVSNISGKGDRADVSGPGAGAYAAYYGSVPLRYMFPHKMGDTPLGMMAPSVFGSEKDSPQGKQGIGLSDILPGSLGTAAGAAEDRFRFAYPDTAAQQDAENYARGQQPQDFTAIGVGSIKSPGKGLGGLFGGLFGRKVQPPAGPDFRYNRVLGDAAIALKNGSTIADAAEYAGLPAADLARVVTENRDAFQQAHPLSDAAWTRLAKEARAIKAQLASSPAPAAPAAPLTSSDLPPAPQGGGLTASIPWEQTALGKLEATRRAEQLGIAGTSIGAAPAGLPPAGLGAAANPWGAETLRALEAYHGKPEGSLTLNDLMNEDPAAVRREMASYAPPAQSMALVPSPAPAGLSASLPVDAPAQPSVAAPRTIGERWEAYFNSLPPELAARERAMRGPNLGSQTVPPPMPPLERAAWERVNSPVMNENLQSLYRQAGVTDPAALAAGGRASVPPATPVNVSPKPAPAAKVSPPPGDGIKTPSAGQISQAQTIVQKHEEANGVPMKRFTPAQRLAVYNDLRPVMGSVPPTKWPPFVR